MSVRNSVASSSSFTKTTKRRECSLLKYLTIAEWTLSSKNPFSEAPDEGSRIHRNSNAHGPESHRHYQAKYRCSTLFVNEVVQSDLSTREMVQFTMKISRKRRPRCYKKLCRPSKNLLKDLQSHHSANCRLKQVLYNAIPVSFWLLGCYSPRIELGIAGPSLF
jgi:hypothetical protein